MQTTIEMGLAEADRAAAAALFWEAFGPKLGRLLGPEARGHAYLARAMALDRALVARDEAGRLVGLAGVKTASAGFLSGDDTVMRDTYGWMGALWRGPLLERTASSLDPGQWGLDGLCVAASRRCEGIGRALIDTLAIAAREAGQGALRLDVAKDNLRAQALYRRAGFVTVADRRLGLLAPVLGVRDVYTMLRPL